MIEANDPSLRDASTTVGVIFRQFTAERVPFSWQLSSERKGGEGGRFFYGTFFAGTRSAGIHQQPTA